MNIIEELKFRGLLNQETSGFSDHLLSAHRSFFVGIDPTADSIHIGNLIPLMMARHLQAAGHTPIFLVGESTAKVGDPSGKNQERELTVEEVVERNTWKVTATLRRLLGGKVKIIANSDWLDGIKFIDVLRSVGKHMNMNTMLNRRSVQNRLATGLSFTEFSYQVLQAIDFLALFIRDGVTMQIGGSDQWGNMIAGVDLIKADQQFQVFAATCPLLTDSNGQKLGKTAAGETLWVDAHKTSPFQWQQFLLNLSDEDAERLFKIFSMADVADIKQIIETAHQHPEEKVLHHMLVTDLITWLFGHEALLQVQFLARFLFKQDIDQALLQDMQQTDWEAFKFTGEVHSLSRNDIKRGLKVANALSQIGATSSVGGARRAIENDKCVRLNGRSVTDSQLVLTEADLFHDRFLFLQKGKKNKFIIEVK